MSPVAQCGLLFVGVLLVQTLHGCEDQEEDQERRGTLKSAISMGGPRGYKLSKGDEKFYKGMLPFLPKVDGKAMGISKADTEVFLPVSYYAQEAWPQETPKPMESGCRDFWVERQSASGGWHSHYFTWLSKSLAQPILSGYKTSGSDFQYKGSSWQDHTGKRPCGSTFADCWFTGMTNKHFGGQKSTCCEGDACSSWLTEQGFENHGISTAIYDKGHMVPDAALAMQFGADMQTYSMCNIAPQTSALNAQKWKYHESMLNCVGKKKELVILGGPLPPFRADPAKCLKGGGDFNDKLIEKSSGSSGGLDAWPTERDFVPAGYWKTVLDVERGLTFVYLFNNDFIGDACEFQFAGKSGMGVIEKATGFKFPAVWKAKFGRDSEDLVLETGCKAPTLKDEECAGRSAPKSR